jgi:Domain of unknown function (DUF4865)
VHAMQYEITLPADYDMAVIRHRVATRGSRTDTFPGLGVEAYAIRERGVWGSPVNQYAPFYLWADSAGMNEFLFGAPFAGLSADFGRPTVRHWTGVAFRRGPAWTDRPIAATRTTRTVPADLALPALIDEAVAELDRDADAPGLHSGALVVDPATWEMVGFRLWAGPPPAGPGERYQILHISSPQPDALPQASRRGPGRRSRTRVHPAVLPARWPRAARHAAAG